MTFPVYVQAAAGVRRVPPDGDAVGDFFDGGSTPITPPGALWALSCWRAYYVCVNDSGDSDNAEVNESVCTGRTTPDADI